MSDLIGLEVRDMNSNKIGNVKALHDFGAGDIVEIMPLVGESFFATFTEATIPLIDLGAGYLCYNAPEMLNAAFHQER